MRMPLGVTGLLVAAVGAATTVSSASAEARRSYGNGYLGSVTAYSRYGPQTYTSPIRRGRQGLLEVRMPHGTWIQCAFSCKETLRTEVLDYWTSRDGGGDVKDGVGYIHFRWSW